MGTNLKQKQTAALVRMLSFNQASVGDEGSGDGSEWSDQWKVLVYDRKCRDIISPLLNVSKLRKRGVTLHLLLESDREEIPDVPSVYFIEPSAENIQKIAEDCAKRLYSSFYLNFVSKLDRALMERLARDCLAANAASLISKVFDQYLDFVSLEPKLFMLNYQQSYLGYNNPRCTDADIEAYTRAITYGLFSVFATMGSVPIIRCASGGPAEMVAQQLNTLLSEHIQSNTQFFTGASQPTGAGAGGGGATASFYRPLLIIFDRNDDLITALHHTSTYQALIDDVLHHKLNRVTVETPDPEGGQAKKKTYDLDVENDSFFGRYAGALFPEAIQANGSELNEVSKKEEEIRARTVTQLGGAMEDVGQDGGAKELLSAVDSLPKLLERKKILEVHTNILQAIMTVIAAREIPVLFDMEENMVTTGRADRAALKQMLGDPTKGSLSDKLRLLAVYTLTSKASSGDLGELEEAIRQAYNHAPTQAQQAGPLAATPTPEEVDQGINAVEYLRKQQSMQHLPDRAEVEAGAKGAGGGGGGYVSTFITKAQSQATGLLAKASNLLSRRNSLYVTRVVENLCTFKANSEDEAFLYLDPRVRGVDPSSLKGRAPYREVVVFMIGGGCYAEFQNLQEYSRQQPASAPRHIMYGCTELLNSEGFLAQLSELGRRSS